MTSTDTGVIERNLADVRERIETAAQRAGRKASDITLIAVSKTHSSGTVSEALKAGVQIFGENRVQEAQKKWPNLKSQWPNTELHLIGPLQTNKVKAAVEIFDAFHVIDRPKLARVLAEALSDADRQPALFVQVNTGEEEQKSGVLPDQVDDFIKQCTDEYGLTICGLMCIPPQDEEASLHFALLAKIAARNNLSCLSMGMSHDFETAIALGATHVRVGTAIFGARQKM